MKLIKKDEIFNNINSEYEISEENQKKLMNGNAQFIIEMANNLKITSYSITSLAIHLCHSFFYQRCYFNYDRFLIAASCLLLAFKLRDQDSRMKNIVINYHKLIQKIESRSEIMNENIFQDIKDKICIAESKVLKAISFDFDIVLPLDYFDVLVKKFCPNENSENIFYITKVIILDSYRTYACLIYKPLTIAVACVLIACSYYKIDPYLYRLEKLKDYNPENLSEEEAYKKWLTYLSKEFNSDLSMEDIKDCIYMFNELLYLNYVPKGYEEAEKAREQRQKLRENDKTEEDFKKEDQKNQEEGEGKMEEEQDDADDDEENNSSNQKGNFTDSSAKNEQLPPPQLNSKDSNQSSLAQLITQKQ